MTFREFCGFNWLAGIMLAVALHTLVLVDGGDPEGLERRAKMSTAYLFAAAGGGVVGIVALFYWYALTGQDRSVVGDVEGG